MRRAVVAIWIAALVISMAVYARKPIPKAGPCAGRAARFGVSNAYACAPTWTPPPQTFTPTSTATPTQTGTATPTATPTPACQAAPNGLTATAASSTQINLAWTAPCGAVTGYQIWRGDGTHMVLVNTTGTAATTYNDGAVNAIAPSTTWSYQVAAIIGGVPTALSSVASATTSATAAHSIGSYTCPGGATNLTAAQDVHNIVNNGATGVTYCFAAGTYRASSLTYYNLLDPPANTTLIGGTGVILNGSVVISAWTLTAGTYKSNSTTLQANPGDYNNSQCQVANPLCGQTQDMYRDGVPLIPVASHAALIAAGTGHWFWTPGAGGATGTAEVFDNPAGHTLELSVQRTAIAGNSKNGVTIKGFKIIQFASPQQAGAIGGTPGFYPGTGWLVQDNELTANHYGGILLGGLGGGTHNVVGNWAHDNGNMGIQVNGSGNTVSGPEMNNNHYAGYNCGFECGNKQVSYNSTYSGIYSHDQTPGSGIWFDQQAYNDQIINSHIKNNQDQCVFYEISCNGIIKYNWCDVNGYGPANYVFTGGIVVSTGGFTTIANNIVTMPATAPANNAAISLIEQNRLNGSGSCYAGTPLLLRSTTVSGNVVTIAGANQYAAVLTEDEGDTTIYSDANVFNGGNIYNGLANSTNPFSYNQANRNCAYWHANVESGATCNN